jgi:hypothetical protein
MDGKELMAENANCFAQLVLWGLCADCITGACCNHIFQKFFPGNWGYRMAILEQRETGLWGYFCVILP